MRRSSSMKGLTFPAFAFGTIASWPIALGATTADAAKLTCSFTEPFFSITFDSATGKLVRLSADDADPKTGEIIPKIIAEHATVVRKDKWEGVPSLLVQTFGETLLEVRLAQGDDGMSDNVFPFQGVVGDHVGGCQTETAPAFDMAKELEALGVKD